MASLGRWSKYFFDLWTNVFVEFLPVAFGQRLGGLVTSSGFERVAKLEQERHVRERKVLTLVTHRQSTWYFYRGRRPAGRRFASCHQIVERVSKGHSQPDQ